MLFLGKVAGMIGTYIVSQGQGMPGLDEKVVVHSRMVEVVKDGCTDEDMVSRLNPS